MFDGTPKYSKDTLSQKGLGSYTLCSSCNNSTGGWYGDSFKDFATQGMEILKKQDSAVVRGIYTFKPLNVFKQIITMFLSADKSGYLRTQYKLDEFVLNKTLNSFPDELKIYIYSNASPYKRFIGYCLSTDHEFKIQKWAEINFQPFGYLLTENSTPPNELMVDITSWYLQKYDDLKRVDMTTCYLKVSNSIIGTYG